jgi:hypothetical protein
MLGEGEQDEDEEGRRTGVDVGEIHNGHNVLPL